VSKGEWYRVVFSDGITADIQAEDAIHAAKRAARKRAAKEKKLRVLSARRKK
jgi:hypothetical protein